MSHLLLEVYKESVNVSVFSNIFVINRLKNRLYKPKMCISLQGDFEKITNQFEEIIKKFKCNTVSLALYVIDMETDFIKITQLSIEEKIRLYCRTMKNLKLDTITSTTSVQKIDNELFFVITNGTLSILSKQIVDFFNSRFIAVKEIFCLQQQMIRNFSLALLPQKHDWKCWIFKINDSWNLTVSWKKNIIITRLLTNLIETAKIADQISEEIIQTFQFLRKNMYKRNTIELFCEETKFFDSSNISYIEKVLETKVYFEKILKTEFRVFKKSYSRFFKQTFRNLNLLKLQKIYCLNNYIKKISIILCFISVSWSMQNWIKIMHTENSLKQILKNVNFPEKNVLSSKKIFSLLKNTDLDKQAIEICQYKTYKQFLEKQLLNTFFDIFYNTHKNFFLISAESKFVTLQNVEENRKKSLKNKAVSIKLSFSPSEIYKEQRNQNFLEKNLNEKCQLITKVLKNLPILQHYDTKITTFSNLEDKSINLECLILKRKTKGK